MSAARDLARSRNMLVVEDVDLIETAVVELLRRREGFDLWIVNLGAGSGTTVLAALEAADGVDGNVFIDCFDISPENLAWCELAVLNVGHMEDHYSHRLDSVTAAEKFATGEVDMVMIDTSHDYRTTVDELVAWRRPLKPDGFVWLHDYVGDYPGVTLAVDEAVSIGVLAIVEQRGLGVLCRYIGDPE